MTAHRASDPWAPVLQISRQDNKELLECYPAELLNGARIYVRKADRAYAHATHQKRGEKKVKWHGRALWNLCQAAFAQLVAEAMVELEIPQPKGLTHRQLELCWHEAMRRAQVAAKAGASQQAGRN